MAIHHCTKFLDGLSRGRPPARPVPRAGRGAVIPVAVEDGNVTIVVRRAGTGRVLHRERVKNRVVTTGLWALRDLLVDIGLSPRIFAVGTDPTPTTDGMASLLSESYRIPISRRERIGTKAVFQAHLTENVPASQPVTLQEAGLFVNTGWASGELTTGGALFARTVFTPINKTSSVWVTFTWEIPLSRGTG